MFQSAIRGLDNGTGPEQGDRVCAVFGINADRSDELRACVYLSFTTHLALIRAHTLPNGEIAEQILGAAPVAFNANDWYKLTIRRNGSNTSTSVWFTHEDEPLIAPLVLAYDNTSAALGRFGWRFERESPPKPAPFLWITSA